MDFNANDPAKKSWVSVSDESDFPIQNLPFGVYRDKSTAHRVCSSIGDHIIDLYKLCELGYLEGMGFELSDFAGPHLNPLMKHGKASMRRLRNAISELMDENTAQL
jgi:fumarylacetoacetase